MQSSLHGVFEKKSGEIRMEKYISYLVLGIVLVILGITNIRGNIASIHWYNRRKVTEEDRPKYGKWVGAGTCTIGGSLILSALLGFALRLEETDYLVLAGCVIGLILILYGQLRYNRGIF